MVLAAAIVLIGLFGPFFAPDGPAEIDRLAYESPSSAHVFGLDYLGRDVLSRFLWGGRTALAMALLATLLGYVIGLTVGLAAAYSRGLPGRLADARERRAARLSRHDLRAPPALRPTAAASRS